MGRMLLLCLFMVLPSKTTCESEVAKRDVENDK